MIRSVPHPERTPRTARPAAAPAAAGGKEPKKNAFTSGAWEEARALIWLHRKRLAVGLVLMVVNRLAGLVLPATTKYFVDDVIGKGRWDMLPQIVLAAGGATIIDAGTA